MKTLRIILNRISVFFAKMADGLETKQELQLKALETEIKKLKGMLKPGSAGAEDNKLSKKKPRTKGE